MTPGFCWLLKMSRVCVADKSFTPSFHCWVSVTKFQTQRAAGRRPLASLVDKEQVQDTSSRVWRFYFFLLGKVENLEPSAPTAEQIRYVLFHNAVPFVGFGFLDNAIMIAAGTQIEMSIGVTLGISTMAAAAFGNLVSDLAGLGLAGYVEALASKLGMQGPDLTPKQVDMWQTRVSSHMGKAIGVSIGCILGMFPLFFLDDEKEKKEKEAPPCSTAASS
ncbi:transmembrane protein 65 isoform X2 [Gasterosteus aculeatus]